MGVSGVWRAAVTLLLLSVAVARPVAVYGSITEVWRSPEGMFNPGAVSANSADSSVWIADYDAGAIIHVAADGTELLRKPGIRGAIGLSVNSADDSVWVVAYSNGEVLHLAADGTELWRGSGFGGFMMASASPADGSCWVGGVAKLVHLSEAGEEIGRYVHSEGSVAIPSVDPRDGSCWASIVATSSVVHVASDGTLLWQTDDMPAPGSVSVNSTDGSCWICGGGASDGGTGPYVSRVIHLAADGTELWRRDGWWTPDGGPWVAANPKDGSCWALNNVLETPHHAGLTLVGVDGTVRGQHELSESWIAGMSADAADGSLWVALQSGVVVHLVAEPDGSPFWDIGGDQWAVDEITACTTAGIVSGYGDGTFKPSASVTRAQMAVFLVRALGQEPSGPVTPQAWKDAYGYDPAVPATWAVDFTDVPASGWGSPAGPYWAWFHIQRLYELGVTQGVTATEYGPAREVSRDQMAVFLIRALGEECANPCVDTTCWPYDPATPGTWAHEFGDIPATGQDTCHGAQWAWYHIQALYETGVTLGCGDGTNYCPGDSVRRDEMAAFLARAFLGP